MPVEMSESNVHDLDDGGEVGLSCTLDMFKEYEDVKSMIGKIPLVSKEFITYEKGFEDMKTILDQYQEQPHLLDAHLERLLSQLISLIKEPNSSEDATSLSFKYLWLLIKVRGYKIIVKKMPHEVKDLLPVLSLLEKEGMDNDFYGSYILMMWLSIIIYMPFNMAGFDATTIKNADASNTGSRTVVDRILSSIKHHLPAPQSSREMAAYLASKFVTRPDLRDKYLNQFIDYCFQILETNENETPHLIFHKMGVLRALGLIFKHGKREELLPFSSNVLARFTNSGVSNQDETPLRKYSMKLIQRLGLSFLRPKVASWRYQRGNRSLAMNVTDRNKKVSLSTQEDVDEFEDDDVPPEIEDVIDYLLLGLKDKDTVVRWSAAKGVGRVTGRLPRSLADDVVGEILEIFSARESDRAWHGGCLALAELARRGLFLPDRLPGVLPILEKALVYDELRGQCSVGSNIRDAACYVCWAFARAYHPSQLTPYVQQLANGLLIVALFDREIPCRRAASAAFQEHVGRQGNFPHGIEILTTVDYFAVGNRANAFLNLSVDVGKYPEYTQNLIDHLVEKKVTHWDSVIRELSAKAIFNLTPYAVEYVSQSIIPALLELTLSNTLVQRHGSILAAGQIILSISKIAESKAKPLTDYINSSCLDKICLIVPSLNERKLYRGMGGEYMRQASSAFIGNLSQARLPIQDRPEILAHWHRLLEECVVYVDESIRNPALSAFPHLWEEYYQLTTAETVSWRDELLRKYINGLKHELEYYSLGYAAVLGRLPRSLVSGRFQQVLSALLNATTITPSTEKWAQTRKEAINSVIQLKNILGINPTGNPDECLTGSQVPLIYDFLLKALDDYTMDRRGDIGAWVREASIQALQSLTSSIMEKDPSLLSEDIISRMISQICQQAVERIDRTRKVAGSSFEFLIHRLHKLPHVPERTKLEEIFPEDWCKECNWASESVTYEKFVCLLDFPVYRFRVLLGFTYAMGGVSANLTRYTSEALQTYLNERMDRKELLINFLESVLDIFNRYQKDDRVILPLIRSLAEIFSSCSALDQVLEEGNYLSDLIICLKKECLKCSDYYKLAATITTLCELIRIESPHTSSILIQMSIFLGYQYPKVRDLSATSLLTALQEYSDKEIFPEDRLEDITNLLEETPWMASLEEARSQRNKFCQLIGLPVPQPKKRIAN